MPDARRTYLTFVPTAERLPTEEGEYLCISHSGFITTLNFNIVHEMFNVSFDDVSTAITPLAWAKIPASIYAIAKELRKDDE